MSNSDKYKDKFYAQAEARLMDQELDIVHTLLTELYEYDNVVGRIKKALDDIEKLQAKPKRKPLPEFMST